MTSSATPTIWLQAPEPTATVRDTPSALQYMQMLESTQGWPSVAGQTAAFVLTINFVLRASTQDLQQALNFLAEHHIALSLMAPVLPIGADGTGTALEGYGSAATLQSAVARIKSLGGDIKYFQMDEPISHGTDSTDPHAEGASVATVAQQAATSFAVVQGMFPVVQVGDVDTSTVSAADFASFAKDFQQDSGTRLSYVTLDVNWSASPTAGANAAQLTNLEGIAQAVRGAGAALGVIDDGVQGASSLAWVQAAERNMAAVEADKLIRPDISLVQSWVPQPTQLLPEGQADTLTHVALEEAEIAPLYANGTLSGAQGVTASTTVAGPTEAIGGYSVGLPGITVAAQGSGASSATFAMVLTDVAGLLSAHAKGAGTVTGSGSTTLLLTGTLADLNAELATLGYQAGAAGSETIDVATYDGAGMVDDHQLTVATASPATVALPKAMTPATLFAAIYGTAPTAADLAPINAAMAAGQTLVQAAAPWLAVAQAEVTQALQQITDAPPAAATVTSWMQSLLSGSTLTQLRAAQTGAVQQVLTGLITATTQKTPYAPQVAVLAAKVTSGAETLEQLEQPILMGSAQGKTIIALGQQVAGASFNPTLAEDFTREYIAGASLATIRGQMASLPGVTQYLAGKYLYTYGVQPSTAQLAALTAKLASGASLADLNAQFSAAADSQISAAFQQVLGRAPTGTELAGYINTVEVAGRPMSWVVTELAATTEASNDLKAALQTASGTAPTPDEIGALLPMLSSGTSLAAIRTDIAQLNALARQITGAAPSASTLAPMLQQLASGMSLATIAQSLANSAGPRQALTTQYQDAYGLTPTPTTLSTFASALASGTPMTQLNQQIVQGATADKPVIASMPSSEIVAANGRLMPLAAMTLSDPVAQQTETATISLTGGGTLSSAVGQVSANGLRVSLSGSVGYVQTALRQIVFTPGAPGSTGTLAVAVQNGAGKSSAATAAISVETVRTAVPAMFLAASNGSDQLTGTAAANVFVIPAGTGQHVIASFDPAHDMLDLPKAIVPNMAALQADITQQNGGVHIALGANESVQLPGALPASLNASNVNFL